MPTWDTSPLLQSFAAILVVGLLVVLLRWTFSHGHSLVERRSRPGAETDYGMLVPVASAATFVEAELLRQRLLAHSIRATLAPTTSGPRVMVWPDDLELARTVLAEQG